MRPAVNPVSRIILVRTAQASILSLVLHLRLHWPLTGPHALGLFVTPLLCLYFVFVFVAPWSWGLPLLTRLPARERAVALTFDDGPSPETTPMILDALARHGVRATFFVLGENVNRRPDLLRRIVAEGHTVGIHGFRHEPFVLLSWNRVGEEIRQTRSALSAACPDIGAVTWLRPPHGFKTLALPLIACRSGCRIAAWSVNSHDYRTQDPDAITKSVLSALSPGTIILLHDGTRNTATAAALPQILAALARADYQCLPL